MWALVFGSGSMCRCLERKTLVPVAMMLKLILMLTMTEEMMRISPVPMMKARTFSMPGGKMSQEKIWSPKKTIKPRLKVRRRKTAKEEVKDSIFCLFIGEIIAKI